MFSLGSSLCLLTGLLKSYTEGLDIFLGPIEYILSDLDSRSGSVEVKSSKSLVLRHVIESRDKNLNVTC